MYEIEQITKATLLDIHVTVANEDLYPFLIMGPAKVFSALGALSLCNIYVDTQ